ncbi:MAG: Alpha/beta hydrolase family protein [Methanocella sp. PtaU1.Bin125]|nr:MAG: Alpha/beta hydrolase family protein [Methanocella sp. PtaU1.Bin125]
MVSSKMESNVIHYRQSQDVIDAVWRDRRIGIAAAAGIAVLAGLIIGLTMPRGPATASQALFVMAVCLAGGLAAGFVSRSRWAILVAPVAHLIVIELFHLGLQGPTVGAIRLDETFGIIALVVGRGVYFLFGLLPMALGASLGATLARRMSGASAPAKDTAARLAKYGSAAVVVAVSAFLVLLAVMVLLPPGTPAIVGADGKPVPGSIAEVTMIDVNGDRQGMLIRGHSTDNPVLLYLAGGPGQSDLAFPRALFSGLEENFTVVCWDQPGEGKSYAGFEPAAELTFERAINDTIAVTEYLCERFDEDKIYVMGESYGSILGVKTVQKRPDLYYAYIGSGQMVNPKETDRRLYYDMLDLASRTGNEAMAAKMRNYGEPPYDDLYAYTYVAAYYTDLAGEYSPPAEYEERGAASGVGPFGVMASEYGLIEKVNVLRGLFDVFVVMYPQLQDIDFREDASRLEVPVYLMDGDHELAARHDLAVEWYEGLEAPKKGIFPIANAGHGAAFEGFREFTRIMNEVVLPETYPGH